MRILAFCLTSILILTSCSADRIEKKLKEKDSGDKRLDISKMELEEGLREKYTLLRFICDLQITSPISTTIDEVDFEDVKTPEPNTSDENNSQVFGSAKDRGFYSQEIVVWDVLNDFHKELSEGFSIGHDGVVVDVEWDIRLGIVDAQVKDYDPKGYFEYDIVNGAALKTKENRVTTLLNDNNQVEKELKGKKENQIFYDRLPVKVLQQTFEVGQSLKEASLSCRLQASVKKQYKSEFSVKRVKKTP